MLGCPPELGSSESTWVGRLPRSAPENRQARSGDRAVAPACGPQSTAFPQLPAATHKACPQVLPSFHFTSASHTQLRLGST